MKKFIAKNSVQLLIIFGLFIAVSLFLRGDLLNLQTNLLPNSGVPEFDGTSLPVKQIPNWVALSSSEWKADFDNIPAQKKVNTPEYNAQKLANTLKTWNTEEEKTIRNSQITFSVPYMGNYRLDGKEDAGSHLAVDIKVPMYTPVYAIANGVVTKVANLTSGFGQHIVVRHDNVPSLEDESVKTTYFSSYSHLSTILVKEGEIVKKGQQIAKSGNSGISTTPHVHFQIDNNNSSWHPYWPFTSKEASDAGLDFVTAINAGLGKDKALSNTINPMLYVQKYLNYNGSSTSTTKPDVSKPVINNTIDKPVVDQLPPANNNSGNNSTINPNNSSSNSTNVTENNTSTETNTTQPPVVVPPVVVPPVVVPPVEEKPPVVTPPVEAPKPEIVQPVLDKLELKSAKNFKVNNDLTFKVIAYDKDGLIMTNFQPKSEIYIKIEAGSARIERSYLNANDFISGIAEFKVTPLANFGLKVSVSDGQRIAVSEIVQSSVFSDVNEEDPVFAAVAFLEQNGVVKGYPDGTFRADSKVTRVEALKMIYEGVNRDITASGYLGFNDTESKSWYTKYVKSAVQDKIVQGYPGNLFKPATNVTRAEFLKMLIKSANIDTAAYKNSDSFSDVKTNDWYAEYFAYAQDKKILASSFTKIKPNEAISRGEVAELIYKVVILKLSKKNVFDSGWVASTESTSAFYRN